MSYRELPQDTVLERGKACLPCRRRRTKCDGIRPACGQCSRTGRQRDCQYTDNQGRAQLQVLEENIARLEAYIAELENPHLFTPSVQLFDPHAAYHEAENRRAAAASVGRSQSALSHSRPSDRTASALETWLKGGEPPKNIGQVLRSIFFTHAAQLNFALNIGRLTSTTSPHPSLINVIHAWGAYLSNNAVFAPHIPALIDRAVKSTMNTQTDGDERKLHLIQAEILLAEYFFCMGRSLEGHYHSNAAASLALSHGMHRLHSSSAPAPAGPLVTSRSDFRPSNPRDLIQDSDRINIFWAIYFLDRCWGIYGANATPPNLTDNASLGTQIDTPWPVEVRGSEVLDFNETVTGVKTIQLFLNSDKLSANQPNAFAIPALKVKAAALYERTSGLISRQKQNAGSTDQLYKSLCYLARVLSSFIQSLPVLSDQTQAYLDIDARCCLALIHSLAHAAVIKFHSVGPNAAIYSGQGVRPPSNVQAPKLASVESAERIAWIAEYVVKNDLRLLDPFIGVTWLSAGEIFKQMRYTSNARTSQSGPGISREGGTAARANEYLDRMRRALGAISTLSPVLDVQIDKFTEMIAAGPSPNRPPM